MTDRYNVVTTARSLFETQAEELANYKQLATTAIDDAVALRAERDALQAQVAALQADTETKQKERDSLYQKAFDLQRRLDEIKAHIQADCL